MIIKSVPVASGPGSKSHYGSSDLPNPQFQCPREAVLRQIEELKVTITYSQTKNSIDKYDFFFASLFVKHGPEPFKTTTSRVYINDYPVLQQLLRDSVPPFTNSSPGRQEDMVINFEPDELTIIGDLKYSKHQETNIYTAKIIVKEFKIASK